MTAPATTGTLAEVWASERPRSRALAARARAAIPSGATHDTRFQDPFPAYVDHALGSRKWDVDGFEYVDYWMGHGALILGNSHPAIVDAVTAQVGKGTHVGGSHELEVRWAELTLGIVPSGREDGQIKFTSSGTEATLIAIRLARAFTKRDRILKIQGHFHGWHDYATMTVLPPWDEPLSRGVPKAVQETVVSVPGNDIESIRRALDSDHGIGGLIMIPGGGREYLAAVRDLCRERGVVLIFDEVVTGFRAAPGGVQEALGVTPDLTALAKILAGGLPGGAVVGRADILALFEMRAHDDHWQRFGRITHPGTFNANPLSAAAGIACLEIVRDPAIQQRATRTADALRAGFNDVFARRGIAGSAGGDSSFVSLTFAGIDPASVSFRISFRMAMQLGGVDVPNPNLVLSAVHDDADVARTLEAFDGALDWLVREGVLSAA